MGDLETFDGYMISSHVSWSDFQKQEVALPSSLFVKFTKSCWLPISTVQTKVAR